MTGTEITIIALSVAAVLVGALVWRIIVQSNREDVLGERSEAINEAWERRMKGGD